MDSFEAALKEATVKGSNNVPGAAMAAVDKDGNFIYKNVGGFNGVNSDAKPLEFDQTYFIASSTKLVTSVAALQCVERGLIGLDDPLDNHLPELTTQPIISPKDEKFQLRPAAKAITLRHLLSHSSGSVYDLMDPTLTLWRQSRGEEPAFSTSGIVAKDYATPRPFEAGEGWMYGPGIDWAGLLVARLNKTTLEEYIHENIAKPLGITTTFTWHLARHPHVAKKLMKMSTRNEDGTLVDGPNPLWPEPVEEGGGAGMYANVHDYTRVLADLLRDNPVILTSETIEQMLFAPQLPKDGQALKALYANSELTYRPMVGGSVQGVVGNHGLGGYLVQEDIEREDYFKPKNTLTWSGMPNLLWSINRDKGIALFFATQVIPWGDSKCWALAQAFETAVWRNFSK